MTYPAAACRGAPNVTAMAVRKVGPCGRSSLELPHFLHVSLFAVSVPTMTGVCSQPQPRAVQLALPGLLPLCPPTALEHAQMEWVSDGGVGVNPWVQPHIAPAACEFNPAADEKNPLKEPAVAVQLLIPSSNAFCHLFYFLHC